jgi:RNA polymerase sigma-70 factor (ECF subfamily)
MFLKLKRKNLFSTTRDGMSDEHLVEGYLKTGDKELIAVLFERYIHLVYGICLNYIHDPDQCKDAVMEIFESLFHKLAEHHVMNFRNWLYTVSRNHCLMSIRKEGTMNRVKDGFSKTESTIEHPEYMSEEDEELMFSKDVISSAVKQLNPEQEKCIILMYIDDKSYRDISTLTGFSLNEVKSHIQNGKRNLKNYLGKQNGKL